MLTRLVHVTCLPPRLDQFMQSASDGLRFYLSQPGCAGAHLWRSRLDQTQLIALSIWDQASDLVAARKQPEYQRILARVAETYAAPQSVSEWDVVEL
jgi:quinol monooxygenase YgiN